MHMPVNMSLVRDYFAHVVLKLNKQRRAPTWRGLSCGALILREQRAKVRACTGSWRLPRELENLAESVS